MSVYAITYIHALAHTECFDVHTCSLCMCMPVQSDNHAAKQVSQHVPKAFCISDGLRPIMSLLVFTGTANYMVCNASLWVQGVREVHSLPGNRDI